MKLRARKCQHCKTQFTPTTAIQKWCGADCGAKLALKNTAQLDRKKRLAQKESLKTLTDYKKEAQTIFNKYIRIRDKDLGCISCGKQNTTNQYHAGHYFSVGSSDSRRYDENNAHKQCEQCNRRLSGNLINFRLGLISRFGNKFITQLETNRPDANFTIDSIKQLKLDYRAKIKSLLISDSN